MYDKSIAGVSMSTPVAGMSTAGTLAHGGAVAMWVFLGGFALVAAGLAFLRTLPRRQA